MSEALEAIQEAVEKAGGDDKKPAPVKDPWLNAAIALSVAVIATFMALCNVKDDNIVQSMQQDQAGAIDTWAYFQAKSTKQSLAQSVAEQLTIQRDITAGLSPEARAELDKKIGEYQGKVKDYEKEKNDIKAKAEGLQAEYDRLNYRDDQFDISEAAASVSIALFGVTALTRKKWLFIVALVFAGFGLLMGVAGFFGLPIHPGFLAKLLT